MINIRTLHNIPNNGGLTLKNGKPIEYKTGYQVATEGIEITDITKVRQAVIEYGGNCGLWLCDGVWYVDKSQRVTRKCDALDLGRKCNQISILKWKNKNLIFC